MDTTDATTAPLPPNHHAHHPGFTGPRGYAYAALFAVGRTSDFDLVASLAEVRPGDHVVDVGCGPGSALRVAARRGATGTGVDPAAAMVNVGRLLTRPGRGIRYRIGTAEALPLDDASATVAWSLATVHHWADIDAGLAEVRRALRPGGRFLAVEHRTHDGAEGLASHGWTEAQADAFADACRQAGFTDVRVEQHPDRRGTALVVLARRP